MRNITAWHKGLRAGDLAIAWNAASKRRHIIRLLRYAAEYDSRQGEADGYGGTPHPRLLGVALPPLRQHTAELPLLAATFLAEACQLSGRSTMQISDGALSALLAHSWPENIRELKNLMQYAAAALPVEVLLAEQEEPPQSSTMELA